NQSPVGAGGYEATDSGLTRFGREVVREMNRVGMVVDLSHTAETTTLETIAFSQRPVCISHANPNFFVKNVRNKSDKVLRAVAESGGRLGVSPYPPHIAGVGGSPGSFPPYEGATPRRQWA